MSSFTIEEKAKLMALPLIVLDEKDHHDTDSILKGIKDVFAASDLSFMVEAVVGDNYFLIFSHGDGELVHTVNVIYHSDLRFIVLNIQCQDVPKGKRKMMLELINLLNTRFSHAYAVMMPDGSVVLKSVMSLSSWFNTRELLIGVKVLLSAGICYAGAAAKLISTNQTPAKVMRQVDRYMQEPQADE